MCTHMYSHDKQSLWLKKNAKNTKKTTTKYGLADFNCIQHRNKLVHLIYRYIIYVKTCWYKNIPLYILFKKLFECMCTVNNNLTEFLTKHESNIIMGGGASTGINLRGHQWG